MAEVVLTDTAKALLSSLSPEDQSLVGRAISSLENDDERQSGKSDLMLKEGGFDVWAYEEGAAFVAFVEDGDKVVVSHLSVRSRFRTRIYGMTKRADNE